MKKLINFFDGITGYTIVLLLGILFSVFYATKICIRIWNIEELDGLFCFLIWVTIVGAGIFLTLVIALILRELFE
ncbi:MAG: hypothetical protein GXC73_11960 [Chitinophagaceae bacterium]|nr:hypothetical protein [Chitinophagaceae bacterium]